MVERGTLLGLMKGATVEDQPSVLSRTREREREGVCVQVLKWVTHFFCQSPSAFTSGSGSSPVFSKICGLS